MMIIGDVHRKIDKYAKIIGGTDGPSVQLGDFGFKREHDWHIQNVNPDKHGVLFGNHDYYPYVNHAHSMGDYYFDKDLSILYIRGAQSIDFDSRKIGLDFFYEEELNTSKFLDIAALADEHRPNVIVSHECPQFVRESWFGIENSSRTSGGLNHIYLYYQPLIWIFGHHHISRTETIDSTKFICLGELETLEV